MTCHHVILIIENQRRKNRSSPVFPPVISSLGCSYTTLLYLKEIRLPVFDHRQLSVQNTFVVFNLRLLEYIKVSMNGEKPDSKTALYLGPLKTDSGKRKVYMSEQAIKGFESIKVYQIKAGLYQPDGFVFLQKNGNPYEPHAYNKLYRKIIHYAGVDYRKFHTLRHTFATRAFELSFDIPTLAEILGHAQKSTTENMYGHSTDETKRKSMARFNSRAI